MNGFGQKYVVDTNSLSQLRRHRRASVFFRENALIPGEVLHESKGFPDIDVLRNNIYPTTQPVLVWLMRVMATVPASDTRLIDLYANHGNADPLVVACALDGQDQDSQYLDPKEWVVVTGDQALRDKAEEFGLRVVTNEEFAAVIDSAENYDRETGTGTGTDEIACSPS